MVNYVSNNYNLSIQFEVAIGNEELVSETLKWIVHGPSHYVFKYHVYVINGCRYHTKERDDLWATQNSGVSIVATTMQMIQDGKFFYQLLNKTSRKGTQVMISLDNSIEHHPVISSFPQVESFDAMDDFDVICMWSDYEGIWVENKSYM